MLRCASKELVTAREFAISNNQANNKTFQPISHESISHFFIISSFCCLFPIIIAVSARAI